MDIQRSSRHSRWSNVNSKQTQNNRLSALSIDRSSARQRSLSHKISLMDAMDLEYPSQIKDYDFMEEGQNHVSRHQRSSQRDRDNYEYRADIQQKDLNRKSNYRVNHDCICQQDECFQHHCNCFLTSNEICVIGQCCLRCIELKNEYLQEHKGYKLPNKKEGLLPNSRVQKIQTLLKESNSKNLHYMKQVHAEQLKDLIFCVCKKSHCQKKYCLCFEKGVKCGQFCKCIECYNKHNQSEEEEEGSQEEQRRWQRYAVYQSPEIAIQSNQEIEDIEQYLDNKMTDEGSFKQTMEFQPVNFDNVYQNCQ